MSAVLYESKDHVATITINRPDKRNAINDEVCSQLREAWQRLAISDDRAAILTGAGEEAFSGGADLADPPKDLASCLPGVGVDLDKPVIAAISGWCVGGGGLFVLMSDLAIAAESARFVFPEPKLGVFGGVMTGLTTRIPHKLAMEFLLLGEELGAARAAEIGFVNRVVPAGQHLAAAQDWARKIAAHAPLVVQATKHFADQSLARGPLERAYPQWMRIQAIMGSEDRAEGSKAFKEQRKPRFKGK